MDKVQECKHQLDLLFRSSIPTWQVAARATELTANYWAEFQPAQRTELSHWLEMQNAPVSPPTRTEKLTGVTRMQAIVQGAIEGIERKSPSPSG